jgi:hypothetical protein
MLKKITRTHAEMLTLASRAGFYVHRLRTEKITKQVVVAVAAFALVLQLTAGVFPFASTTANAIGDDNIVRNGVTSKEELLAVYDSGTDGAGHNDIKQIYSQFGISRQDLANGTIGSYKTNDFNGQIKSIGRVNHPNSGRSAVQIQETGTTIYTGPYLDNANSKPFVMSALIGKRSIDGQWFAITLNCGNIVYTVTPPPLPKPVPAECTSLSAIRSNRTSFRFETKYATGSDIFKSVTYVVTDATGAEVSRSSSATYTQTKAGTYTVKAIVNVTDAAGGAKEITSDGCVTQITVLPAATGSSTAPKKCTIEGKETLSETNPNCKVAEKCTVTGKEELNADSVDCVAPTPAATKPMCTIAGKENLEATSPSCVVESTTKPATLPQTGLGEDILKVVGLGSLIASVGYYAASRRDLLSAFLNQ